MANCLFDFFESVLTNKNGDSNIRGVLKIKTEFGQTNYLCPIGVGCFNSKTSQIPFRFLFNSFEAVLFNKTEFRRTNSNHISPTKLFLGANWFNILFKFLVRLSADKLEK
jgi:hypothetical protein